MKVIIQTIPHEKQPYDTVGDWRFENADGDPITQDEAMNIICGVDAPSGGLFLPNQDDDVVIRINVSKMHNWRYEMLVAMHELVETLMCMHDGVMVEDVDAFDKKFEAAREEDNTDEPGDDPAAPYVRQHCIATAIERLMCAQLGCAWNEYDDAVMKL